MSGTSTPYQNKVQQWANTPQGQAASTSAGSPSAPLRALRARPARGSALANAQSQSPAPSPAPAHHQQQQQQLYHQQQQQQAYGQTYGYGYPQQLQQQNSNSNQPQTSEWRPTLAVPPHEGKQALSTTYASRMKTGVTLLMQPILSATADADRDTGHTKSTRAEARAEARAGARAAAAASAANSAANSGAAGSSVATASAGPSRSSRRTTQTKNYAEPGSDDDDLEEDAGAGTAAAAALTAGGESGGDSDFQASGGVRTSVRKGQLAALRATGGGSGQNVSKTGSGTPASAAGSGPAKTTAPVVDRSYLGEVVPLHFHASKPAVIHKHEYISEERLLAESLLPVSLVPIRVEFETDAHRIRDVFTWNLHERLLSPEAFARVFCADLDLPRAGACADTIAAQIRAQLEDVEGIASMDLAVDTSWVDRRQPQTWEWAHANADGSATASLSADLDMMDLTGEEKAGAEGQGQGKANEGNDIDKDNGEELPECRVIVEIDVQVGTHHLQDHIEWDLLSPLTPEAFARGLCADLGLAGEAGPLIAHAVHEELLKHKRDAVEWGVLGGAPGAFDEGSGTLSVLKDKTGLGLGWGKAPKDGRGRGPKTLRSVWRDWQEAEEFATRFELLSQEEVERREMERERATRRLRRETSKFQTSARIRRR